MFLTTPPLPALGSGPSGPSSCSCSSQHSKGGERFQFSKLPEKTLESKATFGTNSLPGPAEGFNPFPYRGKKFLSLVVQHCLCQGQMNPFPKTPHEDTCWTETQILLPPPAVLPRGTDSHPSVPRHKEQIREDSYFFCRTCCVLPVGHVIAENVPGFGGERGADADEQRVRAGTHTVHLGGAQSG